MSTFGIDAMLDEVTAERDQLRARVRELELEQNHWRDVAIRADHAVADARRERDEAIARIKQERESCAAIADAFKSHGLSRRGSEDFPSFEDGVISASSTIAAAIRGRGGA